MTSPLTVYFGYKESPTVYRVAEIETTLYEEGTDSNPFTLVSNLQGPIIDPNNSSFITRIEPTIEEPDKLSFVRDFDAIMVVERYQQVENFGRISIEFNRQLKLGEILIDIVNAEGNESIKALFPNLRTPSLYLRESQTPLFFTLFQRDLSHPTLYNLFYEIALEMGVYVPHQSTEDIEFPEASRYKTCGGTILTGIVKEIREYIFNFDIKDFSGYTVINFFNADFGISKILTGEKLSTIFPESIVGPYRLKLFFEEVNKNAVNALLLTQIPTMRLEFETPIELIYKIFSETPRSQIESLINALNTELAKGKKVSIVKDYGIAGPDIIYLLRQNEPLEVISEREIVSIRPSETVDLIDTLEEIQLTEDEIEKIQEEYDEFIENNPGSPVLFSTWLDKALRRKRQVLYFERNAQKPVPGDDPFPGTNEPSNSTFTGSGPRFERYDASGEIPVTVYGSWTRALDEAKQIILKQSKSVKLPSGEMTVEYLDYLIGTYRKYHSNGFLWRIENYKNENKGSKSLLDGPYLEFYLDGRKRIIGGFEDDLIHGPYREFYENGIPRCTCTLRRGKLNGEYIQWDAEGNRLFKSYYIGGRLNNSYVLDYQVFAFIPCLSRNAIYLALQEAFQIQEYYTFEELFDILVNQDPPLLNLALQPEIELLTILKEIADRISGEENHGKYRLRPTE